MKVKECKGCRHLNRRYDPTAKQFIGPFYCAKSIDRLLVREIVICPVGRKNGRAFPTYPSDNGSTC